MSLIYTHSRQVDPLVVKQINHTSTQPVLPNEFLNTDRSKPRLQLRDEKAKKKKKKAKWLEHSAFAGYSTLARLTKLTSRWEIKLNENIKTSSIIFTLI